MARSKNNSTSNASEVSKPNTRGARVQVPEKWIPHTCEEQKEKREVTKAATQRKKDEKDAAKKMEQETTQKRREASNRRIAAVEVEEESAVKEGQSLRPDLELVKTIPPSLQKTVSKRPNTILRTESGKGRQSDPVNDTIEDMELSEGGIADDGANESDGESLPPISEFAGTESDFASLMDVDDEYKVDEVASVVHESNDGSDLNASACDLLPGVNDKTQCGDASDSDVEISDHEEMSKQQKFEAWLKKTEEKAVLQEKERKRKEAYEKKKAERKIEKSAVRNTIADIRQGDAETPGKEKPTATKAGVSHKRALSTKQDPLPCSVEGLRPGFKPKITTKPNSKVSSKVPQTQAENGGDSSESEGELIGEGEFDADESAQSLAAARAAKKSPASTKSDVLEELPKSKIKLVPADVKAIDARESSTSVSASQRGIPKAHKIYSKNTLPIPTAGFKANFLPYVLDFSGTLEHQFATNSNVELLEFIPKKWSQMYSDHQVETQELVRIVQAEIRTYRSQIGQCALKVIEEELNEYDSINERAAHVEYLLENDCFLFEEPGPTKKTSLGALRSPGIIKSFVYHREATFSVKETESKGFPAGALAFVAAAYLCALHVYRPGYNTTSKARQQADAEHLKEGKGRLSKNTDSSFQETGWSAYVSTYYKIACTADEEKKHLLFFAVDKFCGKHKPATPQTHEDTPQQAPNDDDDDNIVM
ncbi:hypothetical protein VNI00_000079 [Paramarasmius palmivorus]|uniref:DUF6532 domain-containing protein n=1 Tax=Paramarasmius palmivorus TaxID=297713 RepID=A0AAW0EBZ0_9AGAR